MSEDAQHTGRNGEIWKGFQGSSYPGDEVSPGGLGLGRGWISRVEGRSGRGAWAEKSASIFHILAKAPIKLEDKLSKAQASYTRPIFFHRKSDSKVVFLVGYCATPPFVGFFGF